MEKTHDLTIRLLKLPTSTIFGHVSGLDATTAMVTGMRMGTVTALDAEPATAPIDLHGNFRVLNAPAGTVEVQAESIDRAGTRRSPRVFADAPAGSETRVDLAFATPVAIHGHVVRGGVPIAGATC